MIDVSKYPQFLVLEALLDYAFKKHGISYTEHSLQLTVDLLMNKNTDNVVISEIECENIPVKLGIDLRETHNFDETNFVENYPEADVIAILEAYNAVFTSKQNPNDIDFALDLDQHLIRDYSLLQAENQPSDALSSRAWHIVRPRVGMCYSRQIKPQPPVVQQYARVSVKSESEEEQLPVASSSLPSKHDEPISAGQTSSFKSGSANSTFSFDTAAQFLDHTPEKHTRKRLGSVHRSPHKVSPGLFLESAASSKPIPMRNFDALIINSKSSRNRNPSIDLSFDQLLFGSSHGSTNSTTHRDSRAASDDVPRQTTKTQPMVIRVNKKRG